VEKVTLWQANGKDGEFSEQPMRRLNRNATGVWSANEKAKKHYEQNRSVGKLENNESLWLVLKTMISQIRRLEMETNSKACYPIDHP
jgi:hypothetical protein